MNAAAGGLRVAPQQLFRVFKYCVYALLGINILLFLREEWIAGQHLFANRAPVAELIAVFAQTVDTAAWVALLLLFELETSVIPAERIRGRLALALHGFRAFCYLFIVYAAWGYLSKYLGLLEVRAIEVADGCTLAGMASYMTGADEFTAVTAENCAALPFAPQMFELQHIRAGIAPKQAVVQRGRERQGVGPARPLCIEHIDGH